MLLLEVMIISDVISNIVGSSNFLSITIFEVLSFSFGDLDFRFTISEALSFHELKTLDNNFLLL